MRAFAAILVLLALPASLHAEDKAGGPAATTWRAYQVGCWNPIGCVSPKVGVVFNAIGPLPGENDVFDGVAYNGFAQFMAERYDFAGGKFTGVGPSEIVGGYLGAARTDTGSDPADAAGRVSNGGPVTSCTVKFAKAYASNVVCIVQDFGVAAPQPYLTDLGPWGFKAAWPASFGGSWLYMCLGAS